MDVFLGAPVQPTTETVQRWSSLGEAGLGIVLILGGRVGIEWDRSGEGFRRTCYKNPRKCRLCMVLQEVRK